MKAILTTTQRKELLQELQEKARLACIIPAPSASSEQLRILAVSYIEKIFGNESPQLRELHNLRFRPRRTTATKEQKAAVYLSAWYTLCNIYIPSWIDLFELETKFELIHEIKETTSFNALLHSKILEVSFPHFCRKDYRDAVLNAVTALFDRIRERTNLLSDGTKLINEVFPIDKAQLVIADLSTESGRNEQNGIADILRGTYSAVRNPKAHTLNHDLNEFKCAQYLVFLSLLMRRIDEADLAC